MATTRISTLRALLQPKLVRIGLILWGLLVSYDTLSSQFELPTIRALLGMSGTLLPWWGWLLILQAILVYALFEYVRRSVGPPQVAALEYDDSELRQRVVSAEQQLRRVIDDYQRMLVPAATGDLIPRSQVLVILENLAQDGLGNPAVWRNGVLVEVKIAVEDLGRVT